MLLILLRVRKYSKLLCKVLHGCVVPLSSAEMRRVWRHNEKFIRGCDGMGNDFAGIARSQNDDRSLNSHFCLAVFLLRSDTPAAYMQIVVHRICAIHYKHPVQNPAHICQYSSLWMVNRLQLGWTFGERCFSHAEPKAWNALSGETQDLTHISSQHFHAWTEHAFFAPWQFSWRLRYSVGQCCCSRIRAQVLL